MSNNGVNNNINININNYDVIIIGSGPAGYTAGIYTSRANLNVVIFEGVQPGGQLTTTNEVENFPGFDKGISGPELMYLMKNQAEKFGSKCISETVTKVDFSKQPYVVSTDASKTYTASSVIIATGATARTLKTESEQKYWGFGISACATCDGFFYRGKKVFVVGGGDTAMEDAIYLTRFAESVTIVHRRQGFRASQIMLDRAKQNPKITFLLDSVIEEFLGETKNNIKSLTGVNIRNTITGEISYHALDGVFLAIGHTPNTKLFENILELDADGYIITNSKNSCTNIPGVFVCGDVQDSTYRQAITAAGSGAKAGIDAERWLMERSTASI